MHTYSTRPARVVGAFALGLFLFTFASGCGGGKGDVSGEVTVNGKPLPSGVIVFTPASGPAVAAEITDGKYNAVGVPAGNVKVSLDLTNLKNLVAKAGPTAGMAGIAAKYGKGVDPAKKQSMDPGKGAPQMPQEAKDYYAAQKQATAETGPRVKAAMAMLKDIPDKYSDPNESGWTITVSRGGNTFDAKVTK